MPPPPKPAPSARKPLIYGLFRGNPHYCAIIILAAVLRPPGRGSDLMMVAVGFNPRVASSKCDCVAERRLKPGDPIRGRLIERRAATQFHPVR
jgi:hypothetical protein